MKENADTIKNEFEEKIKAIEEQEKKESNFKIAMLYLVFTFLLLVSCVYCFFSYKNFINSKNNSNSNVTYQIIKVK